MKETRVNIYKSSRAFRRRKRTWFMYAIESDWLLDEMKAFQVRASQLDRYAKRNVGITIQIKITEDQS